jgi:deoxyadenosine/deoxycytidine kinase
MFVFISGNIGVGKSTVVHAFKQMCDADKWVFVDEPAEEWERQGLLAAMYDGSLNPGEFQLMALVARVTRLQLAPELSLVMAERSPWEDAHVFASTTLSGIHRINYDFAYARLMKMWNPSPADLVHIILDTDHTVSMSRITSRARAGEHGITPEYLSTLNDAYRTFTPPGVVYHVDANGSEAETLAAIKQVCGSLFTENQANQGGVPGNG